jgi:hypothetical protein
MATRTRGAPSATAPGQFSGLTYVDRPSNVIDARATLEFQGDGVCMGIFLFLLSNFALILLLVGLVFSAGLKDSRWADDRRSAV